MSKTSWSGIDRRKLCRTSSKRSQRKTRVVIEPSFPHFWTANEPVPWLRPEKFSTRQTHICCRKSS